MQMAPSTRSRTRGGRDAGTSCTTSYFQRRMPSTVPGEARVASDFGLKLDAGCADRPPSVAKLPYFRDDYRSLDLGMTTRIIRHVVVIVHSRLAARLPCALTGGGCGMWRYWMSCVCVTVMSPISDSHEMKEVIVKRIGRIGCNEDRLVPRSCVDL